ncbi:MAG: hypothetical protein HWE20_06125 [Gammaproteobacteria bacterium]|nr:hypothetical protein [Gammaproteobacteria bacterium]
MDTSAPNTAFIIAAAACAPISWTLGFNLGAYHAVFYEHQFAIWAISLALLMAVVYLRTRPNLGTGLFDIPILCLPTLWVVVDVVLLNRPTDLGLWLQTAVAILNLGIALPFIMYLMLKLIVPGFADIKARRLKWGVIAIALCIGAIGWLAGQNNDYLLHCSDFEIAGSAKPSNCYSGAD